MKAIGINGSPRKKWNTATLIEKAMEGAASRGAETKLIHLYDLDFKGCISCFACKTRDGESYGRCAVEDDLTPILGEIQSAGALFLGSPIYFGSITGEMKSFLERLMYPFLVYSHTPGSIYPGKTKTGFIYTMNVTEEQMKEYGFDQNLTFNDMMTQMILGPTESLFCFDTIQFRDYSKMVGDLFDPVHKAKRREEMFPQDCRKAFEMGARLAEK